MQEGMAARSEVDQEGFRPVLCSAQDQQVAAGRPGAEGTREDDGRFFGRQRQWSFTMLRYALVVAGAVVVAAPAAADWFIIRGPDKTCRVVEKRPADKTIVVIGDRAYVTREEAERQVKLVCRERR
jgi:hypothetical protein